MFVSPLLEGRNNHGHAGEDLTRIAAGFEGIISSATDAIITIDADHRVVLFNEAAEKMFGVPAHEALGHGLNRFIPERFRVEHDRHIEEFGRTGVSVQHMNPTGRLRAMRANGQEFPIEATISQMELEGRKFYTAIVRDVTEQERIEQALADRERRAQRQMAELHSIYQWTPLGLAFLDRDLRFAETNDRLAQMIGRPAQELPGRLMREILPELADQMEPLCQRVLETEAPLANVEMTLPASGRSGAARHWLTSYYPIRTSLVCGLDLVVSDVSEHARVENALFESQQRFAAFMDHLPGAAWIKDLEGRYVYANAAAPQYFSKGLAEMTGKTDEELLPPEAALQCWESDRRTLAGGEAIQTIENVRQADGTERLWAVYKFGVYSDGRVAYIGGVAFDITERELVKEQLRALADAVPALISYVDRGFRYRFVNHQYELFFGRQRHEILGKTVSDMLGQDDMLRLLPYVQQALAGEPVHFENEVPAVGGGKHWFSVDYIPHRDAAGQVPGFYVLVKDVTEHKRTELELTRLREQLTADVEGLRRLQELSTRFLQLENLPSLLNAILDAAIAMTSADKGNIQLLHPAEGDLRIAAHRGFDQHFLDLFERIHTKDASACAMALRLGRRVVIEDVRRSEAFAGTPALEVLQAAGVRAVISTPLHCHSGRLVGMLSVHFGAPHCPGERELGLLDVLARAAADFIDRVQAEDALRQAKEAKAASLAQMEAVIESMSEGVVIVDLEGHILVCNSAALRLTGFDAAGTMGHTLAEYAQALEVCDLEGHLLALESWPLMRVIRGETFADLEVRVRERQTGREFVGSFGGAPVRDQDGKVLLAVVTFRDITERSRMEERLKQARDELTQANRGLEQNVQTRTAELQESLAELEHMSYSIVHDLRAPLRAIHGYATLIERVEGERLRPESRDMLSRLAASIGRMDQLITDALNYNKAVRSNLPLVPVDAGDLLAEMIATSPELRANGADIRVEGEFPRVLANRSGLTQCFSNLLRNAVKFVEPGKRPQVKVWAERREQCVRFWFEDSGTGIPKEGLDRIFGMFQRMHGPEYEGTGIGLALVRKVTERMGGHVGVESEQGKGSRFWTEFRAA